MVHAFWNGLKCVRHLDSPYKYGFYLNSYGIKKDAYSAEYLGFLAKMDQV